MSEKKQQHYIPKTYLDAWCDIHTPFGHEPYVWLFEKHEKTGRNKSPKKILRENNMYTIFENGERNLQLEDAFRTVETKFPSIRDKLLKFESLNQKEHLLLCGFVATMYARTRSQLDNFSEIWKKPLSFLQAMEKWKFQEKYKITPLISMGDQAANFTIEEVEVMVNNPEQHVMPLIIQELAPKLMSLDLAVFHTDDPIGFITLDNPCVWYDYLDRLPSLDSETIELSMPISPNRLVIFNNSGVAGYIQIETNYLDEINRRTHLNAGSNFIVNQNQFKNIWFEPEKD